MSPDIRLRSLWGERTMSLKGVDNIIIIFSYTYGLPFHFQAPYLAAVFLVSIYKPSTYSPFFSIRIGKYTARFILQHPDGIHCTLQKYLKPNQLLLQLLHLKDS